MRPSTVALLCVLAGALFAGWFFSAHEKVTKTDFTGYTGEARINDFLAAEMLINELGTSAESRPSLTPSIWLPETGDTLVSRLSGSFSVASERALLLDWVVAGGHLVLLPPRQPSTVIDDMLAEFDFQLVEIDFDESDDDTAGESIVELVDTIPDLDVAFHRIEVLEPETLSASLSDDRGYIAVRREWSDGYVTLVANDNYFENSSIDSLDHAQLVADAVAGYIDPGTVWFIYESAFPSLLQLAWSNGPFIVVGLIATLLLWLWSIIPKFGPAISASPPQRRSIMEHVRAAGQFTWKNRGASQLTTSSITAILHEVESRHPGISRLGTDEKARQIAKITGLSAQAILRAITAEGELRHRDFTHTMQVLQKIRKEL